jgi:homoserine O-acetyltransferase
MKKRILPFLLLAQAFFAASQGNFQLFQMGDVPLENGQSIRNCKIGVRTFGKPNADTSNVVVLLPWYSGRSEYFAFAVGAEGLADSARHYVNIIDPPGNGVSSSPSNSEEQPGAAFSEFSLSDMVNVQHALLTKRLGVRHVHLMSGYSMGGMACFDWAARHPGFMDKSASICNSPKPSPFSRLFYQTVLTAAESGMGDSLDAVKALQTIGLLFGLTTHSEDYVQQMTADSLYAGYSNGWSISRCMITICFSAMTPHGQVKSLAQV